MNKSLKGVTLVELVIAVIILSVIILAVISIASFSRYHLISSDRRSRLQNELSYALEHMHKNIVLATGNVTSPPIEALANGFRVRVDRNTPPTFSNLADDTWISYTLSTNTLTCSDGAEVISRHILTGFSAAMMPSNPTVGFYVDITDPGTGTPVAGAAVEIGLVARWDPNPANQEGVDNPQIVMKTKAYATSASAQ